MFGIRAVVFAVFVLVDAVGTGFQYRHRSLLKNRRSCYRRNLTQVFAGCAKMPEF